MKILDKKIGKLQANEMNSQLHRWNAVKSRRHLHPSAEPSHQSHYFTYIQLPFLITPEFQRC